MQTFQVKFSAVSCDELHPLSHGFANSLLPSFFMTEQSLQTLTPDQVMAIYPVNMQWQEQLSKFMKPQMMI
jgi:hypothetical protein